MTDLDYTKATDTEITKDLIAKAKEDYLAKQKADKIAAFNAAKEAAFLSLASQQDAERIALGQEWQIYEDSGYTIPKTI